MVRDELKDQLLTKHCFDSTSVAKKKYQKNFVLPFNVPNSESLTSDNLDFNYGTLDGYHSWQPKSNSNYRNSIGTHGN